jgi:hypothetical protein
VSLLVVLRARGSHVWFLSVPCRPASIESYRGRSRDLQLSDVCSIEGIVRESLEDRCLFVVTGRVTEGYWTVSYGHVTTILFSVPI